MSEKTDPSFSVRRSIVYATVIVLTLLGGIELVLRVVGVREPPRPRLMLRMLDVDITFPFMRPDSDTFWSLKPGFAGQFMDAPVSVNGLGFRGPEPENPAPPGLRRMACFGDSITFGYGVGDGETYSARLHESARPRGLEVVNAGVTGYTSHQVRAWLPLLAERLRLDYATFCIGWNDGTLRPSTDEEYARRLGRIVQVEGLADRLYLYRAIKSVYLASVMRAQREARWEVPRVPPEQYSQRLRELVEECRSRAIQPAFIALPRRRLPGEPLDDSVYPGRLREAAAALGVPLLEVGLLGEGLAGAAGGGEVNDRFFVDSLHFSPEGHAYLARELERQLAALGWI